MPLFSELFEQSKGKPIIYNNKKIQRAITISEPKYLKIIITFVAKNSIYKQGISLNMFDMKGTLSCNNEVINKGGFKFWEDTSPKVIEVDVEIEQGQLSIFNISEYIDFRGRASTTSLTKGMAFYYEQISNNKFRCYCNDWEPDDDFNDLIFDIEFIE